MERYLWKYWKEAPGRASRDAWNFMREHVGWELALLLGTPAVKIFYFGFSGLLHELIFGLLFAGAAALLIWLFHLLILTPARIRRDALAGIELPEEPMASQVSVEHLHIIWNCYKEAIRTAHRFLGEICLGDKETEERRHLCDLIVELILPQIKESDAFDATLNSGTKFSVRQLDDLRKFFFQGVLPVYSRFVNTIEREGRLLWKDRQTSFSRYYSDLLRQNAKCVERLEERETLPDFPEISQHLRTIRQLLPKPD
jgi:hypothetical protein